MKTILIFGDSISIGAWDKEGGWADRLKRFLMKKEILTYNLSISGDSTEELLRRFEFEAKSRIEGTKPIFIFQIGINDSHKHNISLEQFQINIHKLIEKAEKLSSKILFLGLTPVNETLTDIRNENYFNTKILRYNKVIKEICYKNKLDFIDILYFLINLDYKKLLKDGLHPNSRGHELIFNYIKDFLLNKNII